MKQVPWEVYWALFGNGRIKELGGRQQCPVRETLSQGAAPLRGQHLGEVSEWLDPAGCVLSRKVKACGQLVCWLRSDLVAEAEAVVAKQKAAGEQAVAKVVAWSARADAENAAKRGMTVGDYRRLRNAQGHRAEMRSGRNSFGM
jgi:hypothetical protein